jgi:hypothetical protein
LNRVDDKTKAEVLTWAKGAFGTEHCAAHILASDTCLKRRHCWAAAGQVMEAVNARPNEFGLLIMLASCCALGQDFQAAGEVLRLVDRGRLDADGQAELDKMAQELRRKGAPI